MDTHSRLSDASGEAVLRLQDDLETPSSGVRV